MTESERAQARALLTRAADLEAQRQTAHQARDWPAVAALEHEILRLYAAHRDLEARSA